MLQDIAPPCATLILEKYASLPNSRAKLVANLTWPFVTTLYVDNVDLLEEMFEEDNDTPDSEVCGEYLTAVGRCLIAEDWPRYAGGEANAKEFKKKFHVAVDELLQRHLDTSPDS